MGFFLARAIAKGEVIESNYCTMIFNETLDMLNARRVHTEGVTGAIRE